jgi:hypothetical protein
MSLSYTGDCHQVSLSHVWRGDQLGSVSVQCSSFYAAMIPLEIAFQVVDQLEDDNLVALSNASLVCRTWQYHSQQRLFHTFKLTVYQEDSSSAARLRALASPPAARIREYVRGISLELTGWSYPQRDNTQTWLVGHGELLMSVLRMLPLARLTRFRLHGAGVLAKSLADNTLSSEFMRCIQEICAGPALRTLDISGDVPFVALLSHCGPSLKELRAGSLCVETESQELSPLRRKVPINIEALRLEDNQAEYTGMVCFSRYILDPRSLLDFKLLRRLAISGAHHPEGTLLNIFRTCRDSLEDFKVTFVGASLAR